MLLYVLIAVLLLANNIIGIIYFVDRNSAIQGELELSYDELKEVVVPNGVAVGGDEIENTEQFAEYYNLGYRFRILDTDYNVLYSGIGEGDVSLNNGYYIEDNFLYEIYASAELYNNILLNIDGMATGGMYSIIVLFGLMVMFFVCSTLYCRTAGQNFKGDEVKIHIFNRIYNDILVFIVAVPSIIIFFAITFVWVEIIERHFNYTSYYGFSNAFGTLLASLAGVVMTLLWIFFLNCIAKRAKRGEFFRYTLIVKFFSLIIRGIKNIFGIVALPFSKAVDKNVRNWVIGVSAFAVIVNSSWLLFIVTIFWNAGMVFFSSLIVSNTIIIMLVLLAMRHLTEFEGVKYGIREIRYGNTNYRLPQPTSILLVGITDDINNIGEGVATSVERALASEKMKSELVTNVSHDLKTPLTSIIGYIDLLSKVDNLPDEARDYVGVLQEKSARLSGIVSDVFDLAKSQSGNAELLIEQIDLKRLVEQTLGDLEESIECSGLVIRTILPEQEVFIKADGRRLYRVMQNLIDNALKYSHPGTRIFIKLHSDGINATLEINNIAGYEMNFTESEIMQRFVRGDASRSTEGNGLGLSIAQSFTELCGGSFTVKIDGDMFKVIIVFGCDV